MPGLQRGVRVDGQRAHHVHPVRDGSPAATRNHMLDRWPANPGRRVDQLSAVDGKPITTDQDLLRELDVIRHMEDQAFELTMVNQGGFGLGHTSPNGVRAAAREKRKMGRQIQVTFDLYGCDEDSMMGSAIFDRKQTVGDDGGESASLNSVAVAHPAASLSPTPLSHLYHRPPRL